MTLRDAITKDFGWKFFSVVLAVVVWFIIHAISEGFSAGLNPLHRTATRTLERVPVDIVFTADEARQIAIQPKQIKIIISGRAEVVNFLDEREVRATVDLRGIEAAQNLRKRVIASAPIGVTVLGIIPREVEVVVAARETSEK